MQFAARSSSWGLGVTPVSLGYTASVGQVHDSKIVHPTSYCATASSCSAASLTQLCCSTSAMTSAQPASHHGPHRAVRLSGSGSGARASPLPCCVRLGVRTRPVHAPVTRAVASPHVRECGLVVKGVLWVCDLIYDRGFVHDYALQTTLNRNTGAPAAPPAPQRQAHATTDNTTIRRLSAEKIREQAPGAMTSLGYLSHATRDPCAGRWASALSDPYLVPLEPPHSGTAVFTKADAACRLPGDVVRNWSRGKSPCGRTQSPNPFVCMRRFTR
jgi:hypothetical protein